MELHVSRILELAHSGNDQAQLCLGYMYWTGKHVNEDKIESLKWIIMAAQNGNDTAKYILGKICGGISKL